MVIELGYSDNSHGIDERFGRRLQRLTFADLCTYARYRRELLLGQWRYVENAKLGDEASVIAVRQTMRAFDHLRASRRLRAKLIMQATARSKKLRVPELQAQYEENLRESVLWYKASQSILAEMLLHNIDPRCKATLF